MVPNCMKKVVRAGIVVVALIISTATVFAFTLGKYEKVKENNGVVTLPTANLGNGKVRFYKYVDGGKEIAFLVVKAPDGSIRTAFDACDSCYREKKGYEQQGDKLNCKNCNQKFVINRLGPNATGGCNPGYLPHKVTGSSITISAADLKGGARYF
ncbi:MAG: DUF2318 domain-containing protein [Desulfuromonadaceae bacterium]|nr:DUF2318 domain-containing protein [Desulfuromonadaceae bacterium]